jgi:hypothetical protein
MSRTVPILASGAGVASVVGATVGISVGVGAGGSAVAVGSGVAVGVGIGVGVGRAAVSVGSGVALGLAVGDAVAPLSDWLLGVASERAAGRQATKSHPSRMSTSDLAIGLGFFIALLLSPL